MDEELANAFGCKLAETLKEDKAITHDVLLLIEQGRTRLKQREAERVRREQAEAEQEAARQRMEALAKAKAVEKNFGAARAACRHALPDELKPYLHFPNVSELNPNAATLTAHVRVAGCLPVALTVRKCPASQAPSTPTTDGLTGWIVSSLTVTILGKEFAFASPEEALAAARDAWLAQNHPSATPEPQNSLGT